MDMLLIISSLDRFGQSVQIILLRKNWIRFLHNLMQNNKNQSRNTSVMRISNKSGIILLFNLDTSDNAVSYRRYMVFYFLFNLE